ncbi:MAG TPA: GIY-YIG nuclease family protein [bacterium]|nr:GIY-YIG nuclease family protein [bacterium]
MSTYFTYIMTNKYNTVLYVGVTNNLERRVFEHKSKIVKGFTEKYNINKLVWFQAFNSPEEAIAAEKKIKGWTRSKKIALIEKENPNWKD